MNTQAKPTTPYLITSIWRNDSFWHFFPLCACSTLSVGNIFLIFTILHFCCTMSYFSLVSETIRCICAGMTERATLLRWMSLKKETSRHFYHIHWLCSGENKLYWNHIWKRNILDENYYWTPPNPSCPSWFPVQNSNGENPHIYFKGSDHGTPINPLCLIKQLTRCSSIFSKCGCSFNSFNILPLQNDAIIILSDLLFKYQPYCQRNGVASNSFIQHVNYRDSVFIHLFSVPKRISQYYIISMIDFTLDQSFRLSLMHI